MRSAVFVMAMLTWTGCVSVTGVRDNGSEARQTPYVHVSGAAGSESSGLRILVGAGIGAGIGALVGAAVVEYSNEEFDFVGDDSGTEPWKGALVGATVGAALGAALAAVTSKKGTRRRAPRIPDDVVQGEVSRLYRAGTTGADPWIPLPASGLFFYRLEAGDSVETKRMDVMR